MYANSCLGCASFFVMVLLVVRIVESVKLNLYEPSLVTWSNGKDNSTLIIYNIQKLVTEQWIREAETASSYTISNNTITLSKQKTLFYKKSNTINQQSLSFFYKPPNSPITQGILQGKSFESNESTQHKISTFPLFRLDPEIPSQINQKQYVIFQAEGYSGIYYIDQNKFSLEPTCNKVCVLEQQFVEKNHQMCKIQDIVGSVQEHFFDDWKLANVGFNVSELALGVDRSYGFDFVIDKSIIISNLRIQALSKLKFDLRKVTITVNYYKSNGAQKVKATVQNKDQNLVFIKIQCQQQQLTLFSQALLLQQKQIQNFQITLTDTNLPQNNKLLFKITNSITFEQYLFTTSPQIASDTSSSIFYLQDGQFLKNQGISMSAIIGIGVGVAVGVVGIGIGVVVYRRRKRNCQNIVSLKLEQVKNTCPSLVTSDRQFVNTQILPSTIPAMPQAVFNFPIRKRKRKPGTATTITTAATTKDSRRDQLQRNSQPSTPPSIEQRMNRRKQLQNDALDDFQDKVPQQKCTKTESIFQSLSRRNSKSMKPGHKRTASEIQIMMSQPSESEQKSNPSDLKSIEVIENVNV